MEARLIRKHFVKFLHIAGICYDESSREVIDRDPDKVKVDMPKGAFCFSFYDKIVGVVIEDGNEIAISSDILNPSPRHYYGGTIYTKDQIKNKFPNEKRLISYIEEDGSPTSFILCRTGNWEKFGDSDIHIEVK